MGIHQAQPASKVRRLDGDLHVRSRQSAPTAACMPAFAAGTGTIDVMEADAGAMLERLAEKSNFGKDVQDRLGDGKMPAQGTDFDADVPYWEPTSDAESGPTGSQSASSSVSDCEGRNGSRSSTWEVVDLTLPVSIQDGPGTQNGNNNNPNSNVQPDTTRLESFRKYCAEGKKHFAPLEAKHKRGIRLLDILKRKKAPLDTYDAIMEWHLRDKGDLFPGESVGCSPEYISRKALLTHLTKRYHMEDKFPFIKDIVLPHSKAKASVVCFDARSMVESLLTDPRLSEDDFNFFDNNPLAPPPENLNYISDLVTGEAYINGYNEYVTKPNQMGVGLQWYIDGAVTGQFENLEIIALKMTLSCFTSTYRNKDHAWRTLGYVVHYSEAKSRGKRHLVDSEHERAELDGIARELAENEAMDDGQQYSKEQDFHAQIATILESYLDLQGRGMMWDLPYQGRLYQNVELVFWTIMVKCDTDEAELLVGKYRSRSGAVSHLCRYCTCPNEETDNPLARYPFKTVTMVKSLIDAGDLDGLRAISQQYIKNAWYPVRFNPGNDRGIHGACPSEMLHALLLGIFKYIRECFFAQIGPYSTLAKEIDGLACEYGDLFGRQSERDLPKTKFSEGIRLGGKIMAKEFRGVMLVIAAVLRSSTGNELLTKSKHFEDPAHRKDWLLLVEMLLEWEAFLCQPVMKRSHVLRMKRKNRFIMHIIKKIARRSEGMGLKLMKFHAILHIAVDILLYGVPMEHDTGSCESGHKGTKAAAQTTQKKHQTFERDTATRLTQHHIIDLGMAELDGRRLWEYLDGKHMKKAAKPVTDQSTDDEDGPAKDQIKIGGTRIDVYRDGDDNPQYEVKSRMEGMEDVIWDTNVVEFLVDLQDLVEEEGGKIKVLTEHKRNDQIFRAHPHYRGETWRDWAKFDWGEGYGELPGEIWCFVVIDDLPAVDEEGGNSLEFGGIMLENGTYAVVESSFYSTDIHQVSLSDIFVPFRKEVAKINKASGSVVKRRYFLADVDAIVAPLCVVPDVGGSPTDYFEVKPRNAWVKEFILWLEDSHSNDDMTD